MAFEIGDMDGDDFSGDSLVGDSLVGDMLGDDSAGDMDGDSLVGDSLTGDDMMGDMDGFSLRRLNPFRRRRAVIRAKQAQRATLLRTLKPAIKRNWFIGFTNPSIAAGLTTNVPSFPQVPFRGRRLTVAAQIGQNFVLNTLIIGVAFQQATFGGVLLSTFSPDAVGQNLGLETCQVGQAITMNVTNIDLAAAHAFYAQITGVAIVQVAC